jgi:ankyrin repeat protein
MAKKPPAGETERFVNAARDGDIATVRAMLEGGVPADSISDDFSALYVAAGANKLAIMEVLVAASANLNMRLPKASWGTPLNCAIVTKHIAAASWLMDQVADPRVIDYRRNTAAHLLLQEARWMQKEPADAETFRAMLTRMLDLGVPVNQRNEDGYTLLHMAVLKLRDPKPFLTMLTARGADLFASDKKGQMPIHHACTAGCVEAFEGLIHSGTPVDTPDELGRTPLHLYETAETGNTILACGANLEARDNYGLTPLALRLQQCNRMNVPEAVLHLINAGASLDTADFSGKTPRDIIKDRNLKPIAAAIGALEARRAMRGATTGLRKSSVSP